MPASIPIVTDPTAMTPAWLSDALRAAGALTDGVAVADIAYTPVGTGQMGDSVRLDVTYDGETDAPATLVAKVPSTDPNSRQTAINFRTYEVEVRFYQQFAADLPIRTPHCYLADVTPGTADFVLLMENLAPAEQGDQLTGCTVELAELAVLEAAKLHGPRCGDATLEQVDWLVRDYGDFLNAFVSSLYPGFVERYTGRIDDDIIAMGERFMANLATYYGARPQPWTVIHNDYRLDNMLFSTPQGGYPVAVVDWQSAALGPPLLDVSYFIGAGLVADLRREHEERLVRGYHEAMLAAGVQDLSWEMCWEQYRLYTFAGFHMAVLASMVVEQTERGDEMFIAMGQRHGRHVLDLDGEAVLAHYA